MIVTRKRRNGKEFSPMGKKRKNGNEKRLANVLLITAILNLIQAIIELFDNMFE